MNDVQRQALSQRAGSLTAPLARGRRERKEKTMLPNDPMILLSYVNTKLRDEYASLAALCEDLELDGDELKEKLAAVGFAYDAEKNRFA